MGDQRRMMGGAPLVQKRKRRRGRGRRGKNLSK